MTTFYNPSNPNQSAWEMYEFKIQFKLLTALVKIGTILNHIYSTLLIILQ